MTNNYLFDIIQYMAMSHEFSNGLRKKISDFLNDSDRTDLDSLESKERFRNALGRVASRASALQKTDDPLIPLAEQKPFGSNIYTRPQIDETSDLPHNDTIKSETNVPATPTMSEPAVTQGIIANYLQELPSELNR